MPVLGQVLRHLRVYHAIGDPPHRLLTQTRSIGRGLAARDTKTCSTPSSATCYRSVQEQTQKKSWWWVASHKSRRVFASVGVTTPLLSQRACMVRVVPFPTSRCYLKIRTLAAQRAPATPRRFHQLPSPYTRENQKENRLEPTLTLGYLSYMLLC